MLHIRTPHPCEPPISDTVEPPFRNMPSEMYELATDPICSEPLDSVTNADMDGIAVAVGSESGPTAATCYLHADWYLGRQML